MEVVIAGGHGQIARLVAARLSGDGHRVRAFIRNPDHADAVAASGAEPVLADLEVLAPSALGELIGAADAVVFAAGAGPGSGPERKWTVDRGAALKLIEAAAGQGIDRYVMVSSFGADPGAEDDGGFGTYLRVKGMADAALADSGLAFTILRPVALTDEPGTGQVSVDATSGSREIPRADVASAIAFALAEEAAIGATLVLRSGEIPIGDAMRDS